jgi:hypothetical protein
VTQAKSIRFIGCVLLSYEIAMVFWMNIYVLLGENGETSAKGHISSIVFSVYSSAVPSHKYVSKREKTSYIWQKRVFIFSLLYYLRLVPNRIKRMKEVLCQHHMVYRNDNHIALNRPISKTVRKNRL